MRDRSYNCEKCLRTRTACTVTCCKDVFGEDHHKLGDCGGLSNEHDNERKRGRRTWQSGVQSCSALTNLGLLSFAVACSYYKLTETIVTDDFFTRVKTGQSLRPSVSSARPSASVRTMMKATSANEKLILCRTFVKKSRTSIWNYSMRISTLKEREGTIRLAKRMRNSMSPESFAMRSHVPNKNY